jgi:hypothetical protein
MASDSGQAFIQLQKYDDTGLNQLPTYVDARQILSIEGFKDIRGVHSSILLNSAPAAVLVDQEPAAVMDLVKALGG